MNMEYIEEHRTEEVGLAQKTKPETKTPSLYHVIMHNDDYTPMEFVVAALESFFHMERTVATQVMYAVHTTGKAICGIYSRDIAETKVDLVVDHARRHEHPLLCSLEAI